MNSFYLLQELPPTVLCRSPTAAQDRVSPDTSIWLQNLRSPLVIKQFQVGPLGSIMFVSKHQFHSHSKVASLPSLPDTGYNGSSWSQRRGRRAAPAASFPALPSLWMVVRWRGRRKQASFVTAPGLHSDFSLTGHNHWSVSYSMDFRTMSGGSKNPFVGSVSPLPA